MTTTETCSKRLKTGRCTGEAVAVNTADGHQSFRCAEHLAKHEASDWADLIYYTAL